MEVLNWLEAKGLFELSPWAIAWVLFGLLLQGALFTVFPEELIFIGLGMLLKQGTLQWFHVLPPIAGLWGANLGMMTLGRTVGTPLLRVPPFSWSLKGARLERLRAWIERRGWTAIAITRFTPMIRGGVYFVAGTMRMDRAVFFLADSLATLVHVPILIGIGYVAR